MKKFLLQYSVIIVFLIIFILGYYSGISFDDLFTNIKKLSLWQIIVIAIWFFVIASLSIIGKKLILNFLGYPIGLKNIALIHFASISAHYSTPAKIGYPVTIYLLKKLEGIPLTVSTAIIGIELFVSVSLTGMLGLIGSVLYFNNRLKSFSGGLFVIVLVIAIVILMFYVLYKRNNRVRVFFGEMKESIKLLSLKKIMLYIIVQIAVQVAIAIHMILITHFLGSEISFWYALVAYSSAFIIGAVSMVPMGLGTRDLSMVFYLSSFGVPSDIAIVITAVQRIITTGLGYLLGLAASGIIGIRTIKSLKN